MHTCMTCMYIYLDYTDLAIDKEWIIPNVEGISS